MQTNRDALRAYVQTYAIPAKGAQLEAASRFFAPGAEINVVHPFNRIDTAAEVIESLHSAFDCLTRADYIAMAGAYDDGAWVSSTGYYCGEFNRPWLGLRPSGELAWLRFGEFHRMENGQAVESYIFLDIPELMIATGQWPITDSPGGSRGFTGMQPGPMTQDGLLWQDSDAAQGQSAYQMVTDMLHGLATEDEAWRPYWHDHMIWYGPGAFGSFVGIEGFARFQVPFEQTFSEWIGGSVPGSQTRHFTRFGDGDYVCSGGWPSLNAVQVKPFLGQAPTGKRLFMRVCDWWRRDGDRLRENWVFVDVPHVLLQMGCDVLGPEVRP